MSSFISVISSFLFDKSDYEPNAQTLNLFSFYREDDKDGMKFYTDPDYFFQLWRQEMLKDTERMLKDKTKVLCRNFYREVCCVNLFFIYLF